MKTQSIYTEIDACRLCLSKNMHPVLDLDNQPPANSLRKDLSEPVPEPPLALLRCDDCSVIQLTASVDPAFLFSQYVWVTATSATARSYSETYCAEVLKRSVVESPFVVEIASNDGTFLKQFKSKGCPVLGVDPAQNIAANATNAGIPTWAEFFDITIAKKILAEKQQPNIVMARNVIPHVKEIHSIVEGLSALVDDTGMVVIEFHYAKAIAEELHYDSIYHEHLFYFSIKSLCGLFAQYGLFPFDVLESPISGGSLVLFFSRKELDPSMALRDLIETEELSGLNNLSTWQHFGVKSEKHAQSLKDIVADYAKNGKLVAYGASARSSTLMNFAGISAKEIDCVVDRNPIKHGLYTPGTNIPIVSYDEGLKKLDGKHLLLLAWNFEEEIVKDLRASGFKGDIIVPLPNEVHIR
ncbi:class I SAM-dependent methyltransferase [Nitrospinaceae bacterium]|nr:class I SAM-dependent methyltransferase [Nitrospinaceae bacterium]